jgi:prevent-host-death family protein
MKDRRATVCYMETITHREMRNHSAEILRRVEAGESLQITNHGRPAARITPVENADLDALIAAGAARPARTDLDSLRTIERTTGTETSWEILEDTRGQW